ncbi:hypothetical protein [Methylobacterium aerolatum]|uniref:Uncharacterized protein n=1 Tax=Methylobacterium aerolatum TaxID=418708 RepID=A0ABU0I4M7_9HYPH|nr:hypothetical protein [Methylobacterium aerolatum]MDQ0449554.1 hypothetical protein [Methylobacterium aerolatum]
MTFLVALSAGWEAGGPVYAVKARRADEAMAAVRDKLGGDKAPVVVGSLSTRTAKAIGLKIGEVRTI